MVNMMFDPGVREWIFADEEGCQLDRQAATKISREDIVGLTVTHRDKLTSRLPVVDGRVRLLPRDAALLHESNFFVIIQG